MAAKGSRYIKTIFFKGEGDGAPLFLGTRPRAIDQATPVLEYRVKEGDRLDLLSLYFYNNDRKWWRILDANPQVVFGGDLSLEDFVGEVIFIPALVENRGSN